MRLTSPRVLAVLALLAGLAACDAAPVAPVGPEVAARVVPVIEAKVCADPADPICQSFASTVYQYSPTLGALPPGISDWRLVITQFGGQLDFLGAISHGGAPIADVQNMFFRFFVDNGDNTLGVGDLQVVVRNTPSGASLHCGIVSSLPLSSSLPSATPAICETGGASFNQPGRFVFEDFRTADLSAPLWESQGFPRMQAGQRRALFLVEVGNVSVSGGQPVLGAATAPASRVDTLSVPSGLNGGGDNGGGDNGGGDNGGGDDEGEDPIDAEAPIITFSGNAGSYSVLNQVDISCVATDAGSGISVSNCPSVSAAAYTFSLGVNTLNASAQDVAGNIANASTSFTVTASRGDVCTLARQFSRSFASGLVMCALIRHFERSFPHYVRAQTNRSLRPDEAAILLRLAAGL